jgi:chromosome segregation ATPase
MSVVQRVVQKATVRVIASELDRRSGPVDQAIRDLQQHVQRIDATFETQRLEIESLRLMRGTINAAHERLQARLDEAVLRMNTNDDAARLNQTELTQLRFDLEAARRSLADLTGVLERLTQPG